MKTNREGNSDWKRAALVRVLREDFLEEVSMGQRLKGVPGGIVVQVLLGGR